MVDETIVSRSRFICYLAPCDSAVLVKKIVSDIQQIHPQANHHCFAFVVDRPDNSQCYGFSDDGEPNGTAGKPMLNVLMGSGLGEITAVVTRYFGGIKLGTGGLVRAYGGSLNNAMLELTTETKIPEAIIYGISEYSHQGLIENILTAYKVLDIEKTFTAQIAWQIKIDSREVERALAEVFEKTNARVEFKLKE